MTRLVILDLDGTLYRGSTALPGAQEAVAAIRAKGLAVRFVTNNSSHTAEAVAANLVSKGFSATPAEVMTSGLATARRCAANGIRSAYVVGEDGLVATLERHGVAFVSDEPEAVVVGICWHFDYALLDKASALVRSGSSFIATNEDATYPIEGGVEAPGAGAIVAAVRVASGKEPIVIGKPKPDMIIQLMQEAGVSPDETLVVGDRIETDIEAGRRAGCRTHLVLTGVTREAPEGVSWSPDLAGLPL